MPILPPDPVIVEVAPSPYTTPLLKRMTPGTLISLDLDPAADGRRVDVRASMTRMPLATGVVDLFVCFHVLEHIPDDAAAMSELSRVLSPAGVGVLQVPWRPRSLTDEETGLTAVERTARFGQADHVRFYGNDFEDRLRRNGLSVRRLEASALLGSAMCGSVARS